MTDSFPNTYRIQPKITGHGGKFVVAFPGHDFFENCEFDDYFSALKFVDEAKLCEAYGKDFVFEITEDELEALVRSDRTIVGALPDISPSVIAAAVRKRMRDQFTYRGHDSDKA